MKRSDIKIIAKLSAVLIATAALGGIAFAGWMNNGAQIIMTMAQTGLSWCF